MILDIEATQRNDDNTNDNTNCVFAYNVVPELMSVLENRIIN
jgi:hypothetical protein